MAKSAVKVYWDRKKVAAKRGHGYIELAIYLGPGQRKFYSIGSATPLEWLQIKKSRDLEKEIAKYEEIISVMRENGEEMNIATLDTHLELLELVAERKKKDVELVNGYDLSINFIEYMEDCVHDEDLRDGTRRNKTVVIDALKRFGKIVTFADLTSGKIMLFNKFLYDGTRSVNTIYNYHKRLKKYTKQLRMADMIPYDPYDRVKFNKGKNNERRPLTEPQLKEMRAMNLIGKLERVCDLFIFSAYCGMAYCDVMAFDFYRDTDRVGEHYYIDGLRMKTGNNFYTPILEPAMEVLKKYNFKLPKITNQKMNDYLHIIEERMHLNKPLTYHVARHSFATLMLAHDVPIENVARMLGHHDVRTTQVYAKILKSSIERHTEAIAKLIV
ncbi:MAG: tyrosine-type recombinase/integrase [Prevotella sp.]|nr:tyrosine-type recombinase/integrase [Prevotella sp.]